jgi:sigma-E factor negative regulatory protein RseB
MSHGIAAQYMRQMLVFPWLLVLLPVWVQAGDPGSKVSNETKSLRQWLDAISQSRRERSYEGTFVYRCNEQLVSLSIVHASAADGSREKLVVLNGPEQHMFNERNERNERSANNPLSLSGMTGHNVAMSPGFNSDALSDEQFQKYYRMTLGPNDRVAGRATRVIHIQPRDEYRYGFNLWVDSEAGLVLRSDMLGSKNQIVEQILFTGIRYIPSPEALKLIGGASAVSSDQHAKAAAVQPEVVSNTTDRQTWLVERMPAGFSQTESLAPSNASPTAPRRHLVFTDGLASVSVFIEKFTGDPVRGLQRVGAMNAFREVVDGHQITVMGDVPSATVKLMGESVRMRP